MRTCASPLYLATGSEPTKHTWISVANGSTYPELYRGDLFEFDIAVPPVEVQDKIIEVLSALQFVTLMGLPLEQSVTSPEEMLAIQKPDTTLGGDSRPNAPAASLGRIECLFCVNHVPSDGVMNGDLPQLCNTNGCRKLQGHEGSHNPRPTEAWDFFGEKDKKKLIKAGFATPRGGAKGGYQNHVVRSSRSSSLSSDMATSTYDCIRTITLSDFYQNNTSRLLVVPRAEFRAQNVAVVVGRMPLSCTALTNHFAPLPPLPEWQPDFLPNGQPVTNRRGNVVDVGHYLLRLSRIGEDGALDEGPFKESSQPSTLTKRQTIYANAFLHG